MLAKNPEIVTTDDAEIFIFKVTTVFERTENQRPNTFCVKDITLLANGWVLVESHEEHPLECFPPWRIVVLEGLNGK